MEENFTRLTPSLITILANANFTINLDILKNTITRKTKKHDNLKVTVNIPSEQNNVRQFKGQISILMSFSNISLNIMIFSVGTIKITGCKYMSDAIDSLYYLWFYYLQYALVQDVKICEFILKCEMINYCVPVVGFKIDKVKINKLLNQQNILSFYDPSYDNGVGVVFTATSPIRHLVKITVKPKHKFSISIIPSNVKTSEPKNLKIYAKTKLVVFPTKINICGSCVDFNIINDHYTIFRNLLNQHKIVISMVENY
jgi:hypothetical protein